MSMVQTPKPLLLDSTNNKQWEVLEKNVNHSDIPILIVIGLGLYIGVIA